MDDHHAKAPIALLLLGGGASLAALAAVALPDAAWARAIVAVVLAATLVAVVVHDRAAGLLAATGFLAVLGLLRRLVSMVQADPSDDPILLVAPLVAAVLAVLALRAGAHRHRTPLTVAVAAIFTISVVAVANPHLSVDANAKGALFWSIPLLWFPVGRILVDDALLRRVLRIVTVLGVGACLTGVIQATVGFPAWDERWIDARGYTALGIDGPHTLRPFGWSASAAEFALTAAIVAVLCGLELKEAIGRRSAPAMALCAAGLGVSVTALVLSAVRTAVLLGLVAAVIVIMASRKARLGRVAVGLMLAVVVLVAGVRLVDARTWDTGGTLGLLRRSLVGLADPFDPDESTLRIHLEQTESALRTLDNRPLGGGPAYGTTRPGEAERPPSAENDLGNAALAFGIPGVLLVLAVIALGLRTAWHAVRAAPTLLTLGVLGILVASLRHWSAGGHYASAMLIWLVLGWSDRLRRA